MAQEPRTRAALPSATGLHIFAKREGLWAGLVAAVTSQDPVKGQQAVKGLLLAYHQTHLGQPLATATQLVDQVHTLTLRNYLKDFQAIAKENPMSDATPAATPVTSALTPVTRIWEALQGKNTVRVGDLSTDGRIVRFHGVPVLQLSSGTILVNWGGKPTMSTAAVVNGLCQLAGTGRPFKLGADGEEALCKGQPCSTTDWIPVGVAPARVPLNAVASAKTATSYPQAILEKGGDPAKVKQALEKALKALNEANVSALKFDARIAKLEGDVYSMFQEYLEHTRQAEAVEKQEQAQEDAQKAQGFTASLSSPNTEEQEGLQDDGDVENGTEVTAGAAPSPEEVDHLAETMTLDTLRTAYANGTLSPELFDAVHERLNQKKL